ncbi:chemokine XC receptor 1-like [Scleropages formosus]|uniref:X-C motif chemokine receptor 1 n=1 Tax=Scleropages formosus TaxID=113540 RepID=A0A8C9R353_SCLFO|nr:chemokine XC receptor 1-like [Scleropages formosus]
MAASGEDLDANSTYDYNYDYSDEICNKTELIKFGAVLTPVFFWIVIMLSLLGNTLVLVILIKYENLKSLTNIFIFNLALSDLIFTFGLPFWASYHISGWTFGNVTCSAVSFIFYTGFYSSIMFLTIMTIHRCLAVVRPLSDLGSTRVCYGFVSSVIIWNVSFLAAAPALTFVTVEKNRDTMYCEFTDKNWKIGSIYEQNVCFILSLSIISFCYIVILLKLLRSRSHTRYRTVKLIFTIVVVFFLGWAPYNVVIFLKSLTDIGGIPPFNDCAVSKGVDYAFYVCRLIAFSHCCLNPVFYVFVGVKFRNHLKKMLKKLWLRQNSLDNSQRNSRVIHSSGEELSIY